MFPYQVKTEFHLALGNFFLNNKESSFFLDSAEFLVLLPHRWSGRGSLLFHFLVLLPQFPSLGSHPPRNSFLRCLLYIDVYFCLYFFKMYVSCAYAYIFNCVNGILLCISFYFLNFYEFILFLTALLKYHWHMLHWACLGKFGQLWNHNHNQNNEHIYHPQSFLLLLCKPCLPHLATPSSSPGNHWSVFYHYRLVSIF